MDKVSQPSRGAREITRAKRAGKKEPFPNTPGIPEAPRKRPRLPDGATVHAEFDAHEVRWYGTLTANGIMVEARCNALFTLLTVLDLKLRAKLDKAYQVQLVLPTARERS